MPCVVRQREGSCTLGNVITTSCTIRQMCYERIPTHMSVRSRRRTAKQAILSVPVREVECMRAHVEITCKVIATDPRKDPTVDAFNASLVSTRSRWCKIQLGPSPSCCCFLPTCNTRHTCLRGCLETSISHLHTAEYHAAVQSCRSGCLRLMAAHVHRAKISHLVCNRF